ncbi:NapC/NirT family cytochrome c [Neobacillus niacini]|uniref:NapC/NirT family cytochrome c n=1 Tax=Neobacillus niacini TaxID=86668 RepID=UPI002FFDFE54
MDEEKEQLSAPPRSRKRLYKIMTLTVLFLALFFALGAFGLEATSSSTFCSSCHEMKPEYYTWKASSHSEVDCVNCHTEPGIKQTAKDKADLIVKAVKKNYNESAAPIRMPKDIPDSACEKCHNVLQREITVSGDIIIPHDKHKDKEIECIQCHNGVAHGEIADRKMTYQTDYEKWDSKTGALAMSDLKFTSPDMDTCIDCHKARKVTTECSACHSTGMIPKSHEKADFKTATHGKQASEDLEKCHLCHKDMSTEELQGYDEVSVVTSFLNEEQPQGAQKNHFDYARDNTFCQDCHNKRPASHDRNFFDNHGSTASKNQESCKACHDVKKSSTPGENQVNCSSCHPSKHSQKQNWKVNHPISLDGVKRPTETCYKCHAQKNCTTCHKD